MCSRILRSHLAQHISLLGPRSLGPTDKPVAFWSCRVSDGHCTRRPAPLLPEWPRIPRYSSSLSSASPLSSSSRDLPAVPTNYREKMVSLSSATLSWLWSQMRRHGRRNGGREGGTEAAVNRCHELSPLTPFVLVRSLAGRRPPRVLQDHDP